jgi:hypothetical protein
MHSHEERAPAEPIRLCPICRIAMVASKSRDGGKSWDVFTCLKCDAAVELPEPPKK